MSGRSARGAQFEGTLVPDKGSLLTGPASAQQQHLSARPSTLLWIAWLPLACISSALASRADNTLFSHSQRSE